MSIRSTATRFGVLVGAVALLGGVAMTASTAVFAQAGTATPTASPTASPLPVQVGGPAQVPTVRFFGTVNAPNGATIVASIGGVACGFGNASNGSYFVDIQFITGCNTPGATVNFTVDGNPAGSSTLPSGTLTEGNAMSFNLKVSQATATPAGTPPPLPTKTPVSTPPPLPTASKTATPATTKTAAPPTSTQAPAQKPSGAQAPAGKPAGAQAPAGKPAAAQAPAGVRLPNTGNGGVNDSGLLGFGLLGILLGAATLTLSGVAAYRRSR
jgi:hypothetical protein